MVQSRSDRHSRFRAAPPSPRRLGGAIRPAGPAGASARPRHAARTPKGSPPALAASSHQPDRCSIWLSPCVHTRSPRALSSRGNNLVPPLLRRAAPDAPRRPRADHLGGPVPLKCKKPTVPGDNEIGGRLQGCLEDTIVGFVPKEVQSSLGLYQHSAVANQVDNCLGLG